MAPASLSDAKKTFSKIVLGAKKYHQVEAVICPPAVYLGLLGSPSGLALGAQDAFYESEGAYTGSISAAMIKNLGAKYVILGHSERRAAGEPDEIINLKLKAAVKLGLIVVLCVGEQTHDENGAYLKILQSQLSQALAGVSKKMLSQIVIAHEPIWAIGAAARGADTPESFQHNRLFIKKIISDLFGKKIGLETKVLYGGSVNPKNATAFLSLGGADGLLIGRASLVPVDFVDIIRQANSVKG